ncbi:hypothetical protein SLEP1_g20149 [Rubroshorea leprosula]|uniref:Uncharacterized protein n=1 Tax=Rubroshorea leprosula TaxID=152421 RepID=A0AAV5JAS1_9ROSI|nr:hypothetical protein SLEP1_g20149 [Rubroshorea leprosula]
MNKYAAAASPAAGLLLHRPRLLGIGKNLEWVPVAIPTLRPLTSSRNAPRYTPMKPPGTSSL